MSKICFIFEYQITNDMSYIEREYDEYLERQDLVNECAFCLKSCKDEFCNQECELNYAIN